MGIALDAGATSQEALAALQAKYAGQAQAFAETNAATWDRWQNKIENALEGAGQKLTDFQGPLMALGAAGAAIGPLGDAFDALGGKAKAAQIGTSALNLALGPAGLIAVAGAAAFGIYELVTAQDDMEASTEHADTAIQSLNNTLSDYASGLERAGALQSTQATTQFLETLITNGEIAQERVNNLSHNLDIFQNRIDSLEYPDNLIPAELFDFDPYVKSLLEANGAMQDNMISAEELAQVQTQLAAGFALTSEQADALKNDMTALTALIANPDLRGADIAKDVNAIIQALGRQEISYEQAHAQLQAILSDYSGYNDLLDQNTKALTLNSLATMGWAVGGARHKAEVAANVAAMGEWIDSLSESTHLLTGESLPALAAHAQTLSEMSGAYADVDHTATGAATGIGKSGQAAGASTANIAALNDQLDALSATLADSDPGSTLDRTFGAIVGYTDSLTGSIGKVKDWSDAIMAPFGTDFQQNGALSKLVELQNKGLLDAEDYTEALEAQTQIYGDLTRAQDASAAIQIKQADLFADQTDAVADYLESIAKLPEAEQATALAWADTDISGRAEDIADMAAEWDNMSAAQKQAFEETTMSAAALDPMLAGLLFQMGVLKGDINDPSSWVLSMDSSDAESDIDRLNGTMQDFIRLFDPTYTADTDVNDMGALKRAGIALELFSIDNTTATAGINADTAPFWSAVNGIPDSVASRYVDVYYRGIGPIPGMALGGVTPWPDIDTAALGRVSGGNITMVGEHGRELVLLPGGSQVLPNHATEHRREARSGGDIHIHGDVILQGVQNPDQFLRQMRGYVTTVARR